MATALRRKRHGSTLSLIRYAARRGVMALAFRECAALALPVYADGIRFAKHCSVDFSGFEKKEIEKKAKILSVQAQQRGWQFGPGVE